MFPFTIEDEASLLPLTIYKKNDSQMIVDCPFCGKKKKMTIDFRKNVYNCIICSTGGGLTTLYAKYHSISNSEAYKEIKNLLHLGIEGNTKHQKIKKPYKIEIKKIPDSKLNRAYSTLLSELNLEDVHRRQLFQRGLTSLKLDYYSLPHDNFVLGSEYAHIPGCYQWYQQQVITNFPNTSGFIIPIHSFSGYIIGLQIRLDKPYSGNKYMWFSSNSKPGGSSSGAPIHFVGKKDANYLFIIEGALKGNIANYLDPERIQSAACVAGVNNIKHLPEFLKQVDPLKKKKIILCYDMDKFQNHYVMEGEVTLYNMLYRIGYQPGIYNWIDDKEEVANFYHGKSGNLIPIEKNNKLVGFSFVSILAYRCGFDFYNTENLITIFSKLKKQGLCYVIICSPNYREQNLEIQVIEILKKLGISIFYRASIYDKNKKGIDNYLSA